MEMHCRARPGNPGRALHVVGWSAGGGEGNARAATRRPGPGVGIDGRSARRDVGIAAAVEGPVAGRMPGRREMAPGRFPPPARGRLLSAVGRGEPKWGEHRCGLTGGGGSPGATGEPLRPGRPPEVLSGYRGAERGAIPGRSHGTI